MRVREKLEAAGRALTLDDMKAAFFDDFGKPFSVCRPPRPSANGSDLSATVAMVLMDPKAAIMEVAPLPALNRVFTRYSLADEPKMLEAAE
jgi:hypothetical protein